LKTKLKDYIQEIRHEHVMLDKTPTSKSNWQCQGIRN